MKLSPYQSNIAFKSNYHMDNKYNAQTNSLIEEALHKKHHHKAHIDNITLIEEDSVNISEKMPEAEEPYDPLKKYRNTAYLNEIGEAIVPLYQPISKIIGKAMWIPALGYIAVDVVDKYKRGENNDYEKPSFKKGLKQFTFQMLASVILPTAAVHAGAKFAEKNVKKLEYQKLFIKFGPRLGKINHKAVGIIKTIAGLASLALVMKPIDMLVEEVVIKKIMDPLLYPKKRNNNKATETKEK